VIPYADVGVRGVFPGADDVQQPKRSPVTATTQVVAVTRAPELR
jgi:hypothetical protein